MKLVSLPILFLFLACFSHVRFNKKKLAEVCDRVNKEHFCVTPQFEGGRLGNQLFEVAAALSIARDNNCIAVFPMFKNPYHWKQMNTYGVEPDVLFASYIDDTNNNPIFSKQRLGQNRDDGDLRCFERHNIFKENIKFAREDYKNLSLPVKIQTASMVSMMLNAGKRIPGWGAFNYFSYKIFNHHEEYIKKTFGPSIEQRHMLIDKFKAYGLEFVSKNTCAIHIRRGDRASGINSVVFPPAPMTYFVKAIRIMKQQAIKQQKLIQLFVVFSDSPEKIKKELLEALGKEAEGESFFFIDFRTHQQKDYEDLWLMSMMNHQIISNSTFSWWGAYLNENANKIVIEPAHWWLKREDQLGPKYRPNGMSPPSWISIDDY